MHEISVCMALIGRVCSVAQEAGGGRVRRIKVRVGPLSGVVPELLVAAFPHASLGSIAEGAILDIDEPHLSVKCLTCGAEGVASLESLVCGKCGDWHVRLVSGNEMWLESVTLGVGVGADEAQVPKEVQYV